MGWSRNPKKSSDSTTLHGPTCPDCHSTDHMVARLFSCPTHTTDLAPGDVWVAQLLAGLPQLPICPPPPFRYFNLHSPNRASPAYGPRRPLHLHPPPFLIPHHLIQRSGVHPPLSSSHIIPSSGEEYTPPFPHPTSSHPVVRSTPPLFPHPTSSHPVVRSTPPLSSSHIISSSGEEYTPPLSSSHIIPSSGEEYNPPPFLIPHHPIQW